MFRDILVGLTKRPDVEAVYALISEVDPGEDYWPFADTVLIFGSIGQHDLQQVLSRLEPDEVGLAEDFGIADELMSKHGGTALAAWWD